MTQQEYPQPYGVNLCPIWRPNTSPEEKIEEEGKLCTSYYAGGRFQLMPEGPSLIRRLNFQEKARLSFWIYDYNYRYGSFEECNSTSGVPKLTSERVTIWSRRKPTMEERLLSFVRELVRQQEKKLRDVDRYREGPVLLRHVFTNPWVLEDDAACLMAASGCHVGESMDSFFKHAQDEKWIELVQGVAGAIQTEVDHDFCYKVLLPAHLFVEAHERDRGKGRQGFMAMWFGLEMNVYQEGFKPAIEEAGYEACRIDQAHFTGSIYDKIIAEIRRSRFVVADLTCDNQCDSGKARGSVYYEAGFAKGLDIPVILTCRQDSFDHIHFDLKQQNCIKWPDAHDLKQQLTDRLRAELGQGPRVA